MMSYRLESIRITAIGAREEEKQKNSRGDVSRLSPQQYVDTGFSDL
jgi:hypothetical protein